MTEDPIAKVVAEAPCLLQPMFGPCFATGRGHAACAAAALRAHFASEEVRERIADWPAFMRVYAYDVLAALGLTEKP